VGLSSTHHRLLLCSAPFCSDAVSPEALSKISADTLRDLHLLTAACNISTHRYYARSRSFHWSRREYALEFACSPSSSCLNTSIFLYRSRRFARFRKAFGWLGATGAGPSQPRFHGHARANRVRRQESPRTVHLPSCRGVLCRSQRLRLRDSSCQGQDHHYSLGLSRN